jgi:hypothetical protein
MVDGQAGKGSKFRPIEDQKKYDENWEKCFGKKKPKVKVKDKKNGKR